MKKITFLILFVLISTCAFSQGGLGIAPKIDSFVNSDLKPILKAASVAGAVIGGIGVCWALFMADGQKAKKAIGYLGAGVLAASCIGLIITFVGSQSY